MFHDMLRQFNLNLKKARNLICYTVIATFTRIVKVYCLITFFCRQSAETHVGQSPLLRQLYHVAA